MRLTTPVMTSWASDRLCFDICCGLRHSCFALRRLSVVRYVSSLCLLCRFVLRLLCCPAEIASCRSGLLFVLCRLYLFERHLVRVRYHGLLTVLTNLGAPVYCFRPFSSRTVEH